MKVVAFLPIKLQSERLPQKNILEIAGKPLCWHLSKTLTQISEIDEVYAYCSDEAVKEYLPAEVNYLNRPKYLDLNETKGYDIYKTFIDQVDADIYILAHTTSPFIKKTTIENALNEVINLEYDSAFSAERVQTFAWYNSKPINYNLTDIPRTQDMEPIWVETSGFYIFRKEIFTETKRRIGVKPYIQEVEGIEAIDIDERKDFELAKIFAELEGIKDE